MKNLILLLGVFLFLISCNSNSPDSKTNQQDDRSYQFVWQDEFDYVGLPDAEKWLYDTEGNEAGWGNNEAQFYTRGQKKNAWVDNGILKITAHKEQIADKAFSSARLLSNANWKYGKVEVRAKLPKGRGTWSAIWMMPGGWTFKDGNWPDVGEIDIMEHVGHELGVIHASAHSKDYQWQAQTQKTGTISVPDVSEKYHSYILEWTPEVMKAFVNDSLYFEYENEKLGNDKWPYDKPFYLILNLAVGGAWGAMQGIDTASFPQSMEVDYVRIYQKK